MPKKIMYCIGVFNTNDYRYEIFNNQIKDRNQKYCDYHGIEYMHITETKLFRNCYSWTRFKIGRDLMDQLNEGDILLNIDADMCIVNGKNSFETKKQFTYSIDTGNSHCLGLWSVKVSDWSKKFFDDLLSENLYEKYKDDEFIKTFKEQAMFYYISGIVKHSDYCFLKKESFGYNELDYETTLYTKEELLANIEILPSNWNVSYIKNQRFYICENDEEVLHICSLFILKKIRNSSF